MGASDLDNDTSVAMDQKLLHFMDQLELLERKRATLNYLIEEGWFSISKARYSMGNKQVSSLQYASEIQPLVCVHTTVLDNGEVEFSTEKKVEKYTKYPTKDQSRVEEFGPQEGGPRRRNKQKKNDPENKIEESAKSEKDPVKKDQNSEQDPIKWFGILVPQSLKQAQSSFKQVIELSAEIAVLQAAVSNTRLGLKLSQKKKQTEEKGLISSAKEGCSIDKITFSKEEEADIKPI